MNFIFDTIRGMRFRRGPKRILGGIAGGISSLFHIDVWLVRLLILVSFLLPFVGWVLYVIVWMITPWRDNSIPLERLLGGNHGPRH